MKRQVAPRCLLSFAAVLICSVTGSQAVAGAAPIDDKREQAAALQDQIEATDLEIGALGEKLHTAEARRDAAQQSVEDAEQQAARAKQEVERILGLVRESLATLYRRNTGGDVLSVLDFDESADLLKRSRYAEAQAARDDKLIDQLQEAQQDLAVQRSEAARARDDAASERDSIASATATLEAARAGQQALLDQVTGELAAAVEAERARRAEATRARFSGPPVPTPDVGPPNGSAAQAIAYARAVIGAGYSKNPRMGPTYDCSGLTTMAWRAAGVSIPTVSNTQYAGLPHVPLNAVQPGDLIFWGPGGSAHVALYIGGGQIIDASSSQGQVTQRSIWGDPIGAARVT
jgi:cell wall-associated NlpC family hydrolase